jgi:hypothetical protein
MKVKKNFIVREERIIFKLPYMKTGYLKYNYQKKELRRYYKSPEHKPLKFHSQKWQNN